jgi:hypothetical protein
MLLIEVLTERRIPVVVTTGDSIDREAPDLSKALAVLRKPYPEADLIGATAGALAQLRCRAAYLDGELPALGSNPSAYRGRNS